MAAYVGGPIAPLSTGNSVRCKISSRRCLDLESIATQLGGVFSTELSSLAKDRIIFIDRRFASVLSFILLTL